VAGQQQRVRGHTISFVVEKKKLNHKGHEGEHKGTQRKI
jgi:hypothetical protein